MSYVIVKPQVIKLTAENGPYDLIEKAGRLCYKSEPKGEPFKFIRARIATGHTSILEHAWWRIQTQFNTCNHLRGCFQDNTFTWVNARSIRDFIKDNPEEAILLFAPIINEYYVLFDDLVQTPVRDVWNFKYDFMSECTAFHITTSRDVSHQLVRHRTLSVSQESQRYCNYLKMGLEFVLDDKLANFEDGINGSDMGIMLTAISNTYDSLIECGFKTEEARAILPNCTKTELIMSAPNIVWDKFFALRCDPHAQGSTRELAEYMKVLVHAVHS